LSRIPKVSVCIPTFNGASYIRDALDSVLQQKYQDFEVVIVDNCSTDQTEILVMEISSRSENIFFFRNEQNIGLAENLNKCLELARGEYIKYLCVDDLLLPGCLEQMVTGLDSYPAVSLVCAGRISINESGRPFGLRRYSPSKEVIPGHKVISRCLFGGNFIGEPTAVMFRKSDMLTRFRDDLPQLMDMEMWFRLLEKGELLNVETPLCSIRFHEGQMTRENIKLGRLIEDNVCIFNEFSKKTYLETTPLLAIRHKLLMTYRVWVSRKFITRETKRFVLTKFGIGFAYQLMPMISSALSLGRKFLRRVR
jgi:glycosyltransferase involved in cell wall biosynthesis